MNLFLFCQDGITPLYKVSEKGFVKMCQLLIVAGADVNKADNVSAKYIITGLLLNAFIEWMDTPSLCS